jgi:DNA-binding transcriptional LysR family regulator
MEFHQLRYFVAAADRLSISKAATALHVSQPALSRQIAALEDELGVALFDRIKKRIHLTEAGLYFLPKARQILCDAETSSRMVRERFGHAKRRIRMGFQNPFLDDIVVPAVRDFKQANRKVAVDLFELEARAQLDRLRDEVLDLALVGNMTKQDRKDFQAQLIMKSRMVAVLPENHPLASRKQIQLDEIAGEPHVSLAEDGFPGRREFIENIFRSRRLHLTIVRECDSLTLLLGVVSVGEGVALLPAHTKKLPHKGCQFVKIKSPLVYAEVIVVTRRGEEDPVLSDLIQRLQHKSDAILDDV